MSGIEDNLVGALPKKARIEIIPLIDVIFFLLATFVLFTLSLNKLQSVPVNLPQSTASKPNPDDTPAILQISSNGTAYWNHQPITTDEIPARLLAYKASTSLPRVLVTGDDQTHYGDIVHALDEVQQAGITQFSIETTYRPSGR